MEEPTIFSLKTPLRRFTFKAKHDVSASEWIHVLSNIHDPKAQAQGPSQLEVPDLGYYYSKSIDGKISVEYQSGDKIKLKKLPKGKESLVGRSSSCFIRLLEDKQVSRLHCRIVVENNVPYLVDLGSSSGTKLNGKTIVKHPLAPEDIITIGSTDIRFIVKDGMEIFHKPETKSKKKKDKIVLE